MKNRVKSLTNKKWVSTVFWLVIIVIAWGIGASIIEVTKRTPENIMPHLYQILEAAFSTKPVANGMSATMVVLTSARATLVRALGGLLIGTILGFLLALLMKLSGLVEKLIFPYLMLIQLIPVLGLAPIVLAITGDINKSRIVIAAILSFYPVATNTLAGFKSVDKDKYDLMYTYAAKKRTIYAKVLIPSAIPYFFTGLKIAAPLAITASILVDTLQGDGGLGCMLSQSLKHAMSIYVFWLIVFFSAFIGIFSGYLMSWIESLVSPEKRGLRKAKSKKGGN
ncbi:ABC transporter permease [Roseburia sp. 499]|uniref:ABC transporter permease n=1 Tax=Roseburia sp. 499 TaxID=1261634 RepID=UPI00095241BD|nr:ABC transporter permease subunit [Roseburia sp. 499]WVK70270.1 ABC transporter permease subunit [Roseburia sp. 499]